MLGNRPPRSNSGELNMGRLIVVFVSLLLLASITAAQNESLHFEAATIKGYQPDRIRTIDYSGGFCHGTDKQYPSTGPIPPVPLGRCVMKAVRLTDLVGLAYRVRVSGGPAWAESDFFDVEGKADDASMPTEAQLLVMLQDLLTSRFKLQFHREQREVPAFSLFVAKNGPKSMTKSVGDNPPKVGFGPGAKLTAQNVTMESFANSIRGIAGGQVIDKTGLTEKYDFSFEWQPGDPGAFLSELQVDLGLRVESTKAPAEFIVIDHAEKPDAN
jgi:uncharacterized protein (TIGR03435 family)